MTSREKTGCRKKKATGQTGQGLIESRVRSEVKFEASFKRQRIWTKKTREQERAEYDKE
jgi:hypothetical protein